MSFHFKKTRIPLNINQIIALTFFSIIIIGAIILSLPFSTKAPGSCGFTTALFTATSAVCVTGLSVVDIWSTFTFIGQVVLLILMETGGLGFMSLVSILFYITNHHNNLQSLSIMAESLGYDGLKHITRIQKRLLIGSLSFELVGAIILFIQFVPHFGIKHALWFGLFHAVSAFCNAGFDLMGIVSPGSSLSYLQNSPIALLTLSLLIIIGGIGFVVWDDIITTKKIRLCSVYTKLVLIATSLFLVIGTILFFVLEYNNPNSIGNMNICDKIVNSFFQSVTPRTAGFAVIDQADFCDTSIALTIILMFIGGSAGSTAGGIKTVTFLILIVVIFSSMFGRKTIVMWNRSISQEQISHIFTLASSFTVLNVIGSLLISCSSSASFFECFFECTSALATTGLSLGITGSLPLFAQLILIMFMFIGRVGLLTLTVGFFKAKESTSIQYPSVRIMI